MSASVDDSVKAIQKEIVRDLSYFYDDAQPHFDPITFAVTTGTILLGSFVAGVVEGLNTEAKSAGKTVGAVLFGRVKALFSGERPAKQIEEEARRDVEKASAAAGADPAKLAESVTVTEEVLVELLTEDRGVPRRDAVRIARTVRVEALRQLGVQPDRS
jgi:hypothetical protein